MDCERQQASAEVCVEPSVLASEPETTFSRPPWADWEAGQSTPADALAAFPQAADAAVCDAGAAAKQRLDNLDAMDPAAKAAAVDALSPEELARLTDDLPAEERARLVDLAKHSTNPDAKIQLFMAGQRARVEQDANAELDADMDEATAERMRARREQIAKSTLDELAREETYLREKGGALTADDVNAMIARKTREHDLEMKHNVNLTADEKIREDGRFKGERVVWTEDELKVMEAALAQSPHTQNGDNLGLETIHRTQKVMHGKHEVNAEHDPRSGTIQLGDMVRSDGNHNYDPSGKPLADYKAGTREPGADAAIEAKHGKDVTFMEWVVLHELGHNVHDKHAPEAFEKYQRDMMIHDLDEEQVEARLDPEDISALDNGLQQLEKNGFVYVKQGDGYKAFPRSVFDDADANPDAREYFAQHYNQAILAPEQTAVEYLDEPQAKEANAKQELEAAKARGASPDEIERLETARRHATAQRKVWEKTYRTMRNDVFGTDGAEHDARERLLDAGMDTAEFDERAARMSTPDQIAQLEQELMSRGP